jgi:hypothetical protein
MIQMKKRKNENTLMSKIVFFVHGSRALVGLTFLYENPQSHSDTPHSMPLVGIEPAIPQSEWPQTDALDCTAIGIGQKSCTDEIIKRQRDRNIHIVGQRSQK